MKAVLLAAGVGRRLRPLTDEMPKCLTEIGGVSLLVRHLDLLAGVDGIDGMHIVIGYLGDLIRGAVAQWRAAGGTPDFEVTFSENVEYELGSILSLYTARQQLLDEDTVVMDADVLYDPQVMERLVRSPQPNCFLIDDQSDDSGEEMMVCVRGGRALHIARSSQPSTQSGWDLTGEGVGFIRLAKDTAPQLIAHMEALIAEGQRKAEYEVALDRFMDDVVCGYEPVGDLPWTEIDFVEDVDYATNTVLPAIEARRG